MNWRFAKLLVTFLFLLSSASSMVSAQECSIEGLPGWAWANPGCKPDSCVNFCTQPIRAGDAYCIEEYGDKARCCGHLNCDVGSDSTVGGIESPHAYCMTTDEPDLVELTCAPDYHSHQFGLEYCKQFYGASPTTAAACCVEYRDESCSGFERDGYLPMFSCGCKAGENPTAERWYARINITKYGGIDIDNSRGYNAYYESLGASPATIACFIKRLRVCNDGTVQCYDFFLNNWNGQYCYDNPFGGCGDPFQNYRGIERLEYEHGVDYQPGCNAYSPKYTVLGKVDKINVNPDGTVEYPNNYGNYTVVSSVYRPIAVNDEEYITTLRDIQTTLEACRTSGDPCEDEYLDPQYYDYCIEYTLARYCDILGIWNTTDPALCKNKRVATEDKELTYEEQVDNIGFERCEWFIIDFGKYHDFPGVYHVVLNKSRFGATRGHALYSLVGLENYSIHHTYQQNIENVLKWNTEAGGRILGCYPDECPMGDLACTMGSSLKDAYTSPPYPPVMDPPHPACEDCGYFAWDQPVESRIIGQTADYFGYLDLDDEDDDPTNVGYRAYRSGFFGGSQLEYKDDQVFDYESGIPYREWIVNESIVSIKTNIIAENLVDWAEWKGPPYWLPYLFTYPHGSGNDTIDIECTDDYVYLMPWGENGEDMFCGVNYHNESYNATYNWTDYPELAEKGFFGGWNEVPECNSPVRVLDLDNIGSTDRYWYPDPDELAIGYGGYNEIYCTRPNHGGNQPDDPTYPLFYHNPGGYDLPGDRPGQNPFNPFIYGDGPFQPATGTLMHNDEVDLRYYRQFNIRTLWTHIFKVTPEVHDINPPRNYCAHETEGVGCLGVGKGDCDSDFDCCGGLQCSGEIGGMPDFCCPTTMDWDMTKGCCIFCGVPNRYLYEGDYCEQKMRFGADPTFVDNPCRCRAEEGGCTSDSECADGLHCVDNPYMTPFDPFHPFDSPDDNACCPYHIDSEGNIVEDVWDGHNCLPTDIIHPGKTWTRTMGNAEMFNEEGGGPIWFHLGGGGMIPTADEAEGVEDTPDCDLAWSRRGDDDYTGTDYYRGDTSEHPPAIWDEQKNIGNIYGGISFEAGSFGDEDNALKCGGGVAGGGVCLDSSGCNCGVNRDTMVPGTWVYPAYPEWMCDSYVSTPTSHPPSCGALCRKNLEATNTYPDDLSDVPLSWFELSVGESGGAGAYYVTPQTRESILPEPASPWTFLKTATIEHPLSPTATGFSATARFTAMSYFLRRPQVQMCFWHGCSAIQWCWYFCRDNPCGVSCANPFSLVLCARCFGSWYHSECAYPVCDDNGAINEIFIDMSTVESNSYGSHIKTSRPLGLPGSHAGIDVSGWIQSKEEIVDVDTRETSKPLWYIVNLTLNVRALDNTEPDPRKRDILNGFDFIVPDAFKVEYVARDYPVLHDLYLLDSTQPKERVVIDELTEKMLEMEPCNSPPYFYYHMVINPIKKYYYFNRPGPGINSTSFLGAGTKYTWDVTPFCGDQPYRAPGKDLMPLLRNYHEDEPSYWDFVGLYTMVRERLEPEVYWFENRTDVSETVEYQIGDSHEFASDAKVEYNPADHTYTLTFSTRTISSDLFDNATVRVYTHLRSIDVHPFKDEEP